jgi:hypothetical protein
LVSVEVSEAGADPRDELAKRRSQRAS